MGVLASQMQAFAPIGFAVVAQSAGHFARTILAPVKAGSALAVASRISAGMRAAYGCRYVFRSAWLAFKCNLRAWLTCHGMFDQLFSSVCAHVSAIFKRTLELQSRAHTQQPRA